MGSLKIIKPGLFTSIQDLGRKGLGFYAIPLSGVMDVRSASLANQLLGNTPTAPLIECTTLPPQLLFLTDAYISLTGGNALWKVNGKGVQRNKALRIQAGDVLSGQKMQSGFRAYIAIQGQLIAKEYFGSASVYMAAKLGGLNGTNLQKEDEIHWKEQTLPISKKAIFPAFSFKNSIELNRGPEYHLLNEKSKRLLISSSFVISTNSNRMGVRLKGPFLHCNPAHLVSSVPVFLGVVQLPPSGQPIVLLQDGQTTGGYPRIAYIKEMELDYFNQIEIGKHVSFSIKNR